MVLRNAEGSKDELTKSNYDLANSTTKRPWQPDFASGEAKGGQLETHAGLLKGNYYTDNMCLYQRENGQRTEKTGHLCVKNQRFLAVDEILGTVHTNAIIGLGPFETKYDDTSYVYGLHQ